MTSRSRAWPRSIIRDMDVDPLGRVHLAVTNRSNTVAPGGTWVVVGAMWRLNPLPATSGLDAAINGTHSAFFRVLNPGN